MNYYKIDQKYKLSNKKGKGDQFLDWFNDRTNVSFKNMGGIRHRAFRNKNLPTFGVPSLIVLFETITNKGTTENPWKSAQFNSESSTLIYPGDAKKTTPYTAAEEFTGNKIFKLCNDAVVEGNEQLLPPILFFQTFQEGWSRFKGLFKFKRIKKYFDENAECENYEYHCEQIDINEVNVNWLRDRALCESLSSIDSNAPAAWNNRFKIISFEDLRAAR